MKKKTIARSSVSGKIVSKKFAKDNPSTTEVETLNFNSKNINKQIDKLITYLNSVISELKKAKKK